MGIRGDVKSISLANVLQDLASNEKTGTLRVRAAKERAVALWFDKGALRLVGIGPREGPSLLNGLLALEKIKPDEAPPVTGRRTNEGGFIRGLLKKGRVTREDLKAALEHQMGEHLSDAFLWSEATFEFEEGEPEDAQFDVDQLDLEPRLPVEGAILEAVRRADEWGETRKAILSSNEILMPEPARLPPEAEPTVRRIFALLDGERSLRDVQQLTRLGQFILLRAAALLIRSGAARPLSAAEAFERGRARAGRKEWDAALRMVRYGLDHERKNLGLLELGLRCSEMLEDREGAASFARQVASAQVESGAFEAAVRSYQKVLAHAPHDLTAHERLFALLLQLDLKLDALAAGEALASAYKKAGLPDKALDVYRRLLEKVGDQTELLESVAEIQRHLGDKGEAVALYKKLMDQALGAGNDNAAIDYCRTILRLDPRHGEALDLRQRLESGEVEKARKRRRTVRTVSLAITAAVLLGAGLLYEWRARVRWDEVANPLYVAVKGGNLREALRLYDALCTDFRWSVKAREERPRRDKVEQDFVKEETARAEALERAGRLGEAVGVLEATLPALEESGARGDVDKRLVDLRNRKREKEREKSLQLERMDPAEIAKERDPLAVPALRDMLARPAPAARAAAVTALGQIPGEEALAALVRALADAEPAVAADAAARLLERKRSPFQASLLASRRSYAPGEPAVLEWRITNASPAELELALEEAPARRLALSRDGGKLAVAAAATARRTLRLGPGEFVGGAFPEIEELLKPAGRYRLEWSAAVSWKNQAIALPTPPLDVERRAR
jgi:tetratricopeptide (TPR) repeat protein